MKKVDFISMENGTAEEYAFLDKLENQYLEDLPSRLIEALKALDCSLSGYQVSRLEHSLQGATRAFLAGEDLEMVIAIIKEIMVILIILNLIFQLVQIFKEKLQEEIIITHLS